MTEKLIEKTLRVEVEHEGGKAFKWISPGNNGVPDRIVIFEGCRPIFVELKTATGKLTALQQVQIDRLRGLRQTVEVIYGPAGLKKFFLEYNMPDAAKRLEDRYGV